MFDWLKISAGALVGAAVVYFPAYLSGKAEGRQIERVARLETDIAAYQKREGIENEISGMDRIDICVGLGGVQSDCEILVSRMEEAATGN